MQAGAEPCPAQSDAITVLPPAILLALRDRSEMLPGEEYALRRLIATRENTRQATTASANATPPMVAPSCDVSANAIPPVTTTFCPECGFGVSVDEDGCCAMCGATATGTAVDKLTAPVATPAGEHERLRDAVIAATGSLVAEFGELGATCSTAVSDLAGAYGHLTDYEREHRRGIDPGADR